MDLDRPVWSALSGEQARFAIGGDRARRYHPDVGPLAGLRDHDEASIAALAGLVRETGNLTVVQQEPLPQAPGLNVISTTPAVQMVFVGAVPTVEDARIVPLGPEYADEMIALATLTRPGPFARRTRELGQFWGVFEDGRLAAMAGQRMCFGAHAEVSGVCTHPDYRGRGYAELLSNRVIAAIAQDDRTPFLHAYADNEVAIKLYGRLGFSHARDMVITLLGA